MVQTRRTVSQPMPATTQSHPPRTQQEDSGNGPDIYEDPSSESSADEDDRMDQEPVVESAVDRFNNSALLVHGLRNYATESPTEWEDNDDIREHPALILSHAWRVRSESTRLARLALLSRQSDHETLDCTSFSVLSCRI
ncbi:uncharacterized protein APUU_70113A [Aspergillus puulaauensis]|uniref:Uncharacterized protein n=1 Tax=Aspergillus puulaauensis TaxID=1220207 RepID=A0A7R7XX34_9EURO|nr:uncharacterized protein APUU_70113A [Aspergillus puulaauensis]BCS28543.1 hypothetical protein APUU_70113A [Aspergillus puulaauensis]